MCITDKNFYNSFFYRGWRPALGWVGVISVILQFIINPLSLLLFDVHVDLNIDTMSLITLVLAHSGIRTYEKINAQKGDSDV